MNNIRPAVRSLEKSTVYFGQYAATNMTSLLFIVIVKHVFSNTFVGNELCSLCLIEERIAIATPPPLVFLSFLYILYPDNIKLISGLRKVSFNIKMSTDCYFKKRCSCRDSDNLEIP